MSAYSGYKGREALTRLISALVSFVQVCTLGVFNTPWVYVGIELLLEICM